MRRVGWQLLTGVSELSIRSNYKVQAVQEPTSNACRLTSQRSESSSSNNNNNNNNTHTVIPRLTSDPAKEFFG